MVSAYPIPRARDLMKYAFANSDMLPQPYADRNNFVSRGMLAFCAKYANLATCDGFQSFNSEG